MVPTKTVGTEPKYYMWGGKDSIIKIRLIVQS